MNSQTPQTADEQPHRTIFKLMPDNMGISPELPILVTAGQHEAIQAEINRRVTRGKIEEWKRLDVGVNISKDFVPKRIEALQHQLDSLEREEQL